MFDKHEIKKKQSRLSNRIMHTQWHNETNTNLSLSLFKIKHKNKQKKREKCTN